MSAHRTLIAPSILSANFATLQQEVDSIATADWLQVDVMDGHFVPNLSFGAPVVKCLHTKLLLDVHLMVTNPEERIEEFQNIGAKNITFHAEAVTDSVSRKGIIAAIRDSGATAGIALNPDTPLSLVNDIIDDVDLLLVMSVQPGFGGQSFQKDVLEKVREARAKYPKLMIQMDGGIDEQTAALCREAGANNLVVGSALFGAQNREAMIQSLRGE